jgi:hypothetical protein
MTSFLAACFWINLGNVWEEKEEEDAIAGCRANQTIYLLLPLLQFIEVPLRLFLKSGKLRLQPASRNTCC